MALTPKQREKIVDKAIRDAKEGHNALRSPSKPRPSAAASDAMGNSRTKPASWEAVL